MADSTPGTRARTTHPVHPATFPRELRLLTGDQFRRVFKNNVRSSDQLLTVLAAANELGHPRLGLAVARKSVRRAVDRNRIKRVAREVIRLARNDIAAVDMVVLARRDAATSDTATLASSLRRHLKRINRQCAV